MCEADPQLQPTSPILEAEKELSLCKQFLAEAQDDVQQLQAQLAAARHSAAAAAGTNARLQGELAAAQQQRTQLQQQLAEATQAAEAQLAAANAQAAATRQQLSDAKQALVAMQKAMRELQSQQQQQAEQWAAFAAEAADKHAAVKAQAAAGACVSALVVVLLLALHLHDAHAARRSRMACVGGQDMLLCPLPAAVPASPLQQRQSCGECRQQQSSRLQSRQESWQRPGQQKRQRVLRRAECAQHTPAAPASWQKRTRSWHRCVDTLVVCDAVLECPSSCGKHMPPHRHSFAFVHVCCSAVSSFRRWEGCGASWRSCKQP